MKIVKLKIKKLYTWVTATRLRKILSSILAILILLTSIRFLFLKPKVVLADSFFAMNEGYGNSVNDSNGNVAEGTITGAVWKTNDLCRDDKCLFFDGSGDLVNFSDIGTGGNLDFVAADDFTITGWFRHPAIATNPDYAIAKHSAGVSGGYKIYMDSDGDMVFGIDDDGTWNTTDIVGDDQSKNFDDNKWHHFAAKKDGTTGIYLYVDGNLIDQDTSLVETGTLVNIGNFFIGIDADGTSNGWQGFLDEIKVYRSLRTADEIKTDFLGETPSRGTSASFGPDYTWLSNGLIGYWPMDEASANTCTGGVNDSCDKSGNGFNGAWNGNTSNTTAKFGSGTSYDGTGDYVSVGDNSTLDITGDFTLSAWVNRSSGGTTSRHIITKRTSSSSSGGYGLAVGNSGEIYCQTNDGSSTTSSFTDTGFVTSSTGWVHVTAVKSGTSCNIFVNGVDRTTTFGVHTTTLSNSQNLTIGAAADAAELWYGTIDDVRIYNHALSNSEASQLYNWAPGPIAYFKVDENTGTSSTGDSSAYGHNASLSSLTQDNWKVGKYGSALYFGGSNNGALFYSTSFASLFNGNYGSVAFWVRVPDLSVWDDANPHDVLQIGSDQDNGVEIFDSGGAGGHDLELRWQANGVNNFYNYDILEGEWTHVSITWEMFDSNNIHYYINGVLAQVDTDATNNFTGSLASDRVVFGDNLVPTGSQICECEIDDFRVYNYPRTPGQIVEDMNAGHPAPGSPIGSAAAYWKTDEGYGTTAYDSSINALNLTLSTAVWSNNGKFGKAWDGDGARWLSITDASTSDFLDFAASDDFTISMWIKTDSATNPSSTEYILSKAETSPGYRIFTQNDSTGNIRFGIDDDTSWTPGDSAISTTDLYDQNWHHIVATKQGTTKLQLYVDGRLEGEDVSLAETGTLENSINLYLGDRNGVNGGDEFFGDIDEIKIFRFALNPEQVLVEYNAASTALLGATSTDSSGIADWSAQREYCPPGNTEGNCAPGQDPSPVAHWKMDENTGTSTNDSSGNGSTGTLTGSPTFMPGNVGSAISVDGTPSYVNAGSPAILDDLNQLSVSTWVYTRNNDSGRIIDKQTNTLTNGWEIELKDNGADVELVVHYSTTSLQVEASQDIPDNTWTHIGVTWDGTSNASGVKIYINGILQTALDDNTSGVGTRSSDAAQSVGMGCRVSGGGSQCMDGIIDDMRVYEYVRTPAQMAWDYNRGGPLAWWKMDEGTGTTSINDSSGNGYTGSLQGMVAGNWVQGKFNSGLDFDGTDDFINVTDDGFLVPKRDITVSAWVEFDQLASTKGEDERILRKLCAVGICAGSSSYILQLDSTNNALRFDVHTGGAAGGLSFARTTTNYPSLNTWYHVVGVYDSNGIRIYINGSDQTDLSSNPAADLDADSSNVLRIGAHTSTSGRMDGTIDDVKIYNYALTDKQIQTLYDEGATSRFGPQTGTP